MAVTPELPSPGGTPIDRTDRFLGAPFPHRAQTTPRAFARSSRASRSFEAGRSPRVTTPLKNPPLLRTPSRRSLSIDDGECCSICLEPLNDAEQKIHVLQTCAHRFHLDCILRCRARSQNPRCPLCRGDIGPGLTPQQSRSRTPSHDRFRFSAHRGYATLHSDNIRSNASRVRARMAERMLQPHGEDDGLLGGEAQRFTLTDEDPVF